MVMETMVPDVKLLKQYQPLFRKPEVRYTVIASGRGSGKSFAVATAAVNLTTEDDFNILYTRYTMVSAETSIMPEFTDKVERMGMTSLFSKSGTTITNNQTGGSIYFKGIKTSSGIQTAALKSIPKVKLWIIDEAEEMVDERTFGTIDLSLRDARADIQVWIILNPPDIVQSDGSEHFIYRRFFKDKGIPDDFNGVKDDVRYIYTTYLMNAGNLDATFLAQADKCRQSDIQKYNNIFLGYWGRRTEGLIYRGWKKIDESEYPKHLYCWYGVDWGFSNDPTAVVRVCFDFNLHILYFKELMYQREMQPADVARCVRDDMMNRERVLWNGGETIVSCRAKNLYCNDTPLIKKDDAGNDIPVSVINIESKDVELLPSEARQAVLDAAEDVRILMGEIYCDPARPEHISELRVSHGMSAIGAVNRDKTGRVTYLKYFKVCYVGVDIEREVNAYSWKRDKMDRTRFLNVPEDGNDHLMDACVYGAGMHLRRLGVANDAGEN